jgi:hypothetical protein
LLERRYREPANRRLAKHLGHERPYWFTFLYCPGVVDAANNLAERVMRLLVAIRKNWGGNRTEDGARTQAILTSVLRTAQQQDKDAFQLLVDLLRSPQPKLLDIVPPEFLTIAASTPADSAAARMLVMKRSTQATDTCAEIPLLPELLPAPGNHIFSSA